MPPLRHSGVQSHEDASLSERIAAWIVEQLQFEAPARHERPRIGMFAASGYLRDGNWPIYSADAPAVHAILEAGGYPILIPTPPLLQGYDPWLLLTDDHAFELLLHMLWSLIQELDGLVFAGGSDLHPFLYRQSPHPQTEVSDIWRDMWERYVALLSWLLCIPTLGIGRGMQLMNVALGGKLYQDLRAQWPKGRTPLVRHRARGRVSSSSWVSHPVHILRPESLLAMAIRGRGELDRLYIDAVLSMHHQAVKTPAPQLQVSATSPDGVIEALEDTASHRWWMGTQFHPEWMTHLNWAMGLFTAFIDAGRTYSAIAGKGIEPFFEEIQEWLRQRDRALYPQTTTADSGAEPRSGQHGFTIFAQGGMQRF